MSKLLACTPPGSPDGDEVDTVMKNPSAKRPAAQPLRRRIRQKTNRTDEEHEAEERENALYNVEAEKRVPEKWEEDEAEEREARYQEELAQELHEEKEWYAAHYFAKYGTPEEKEEALEYIQFERQKAEREMHAINVAHARNCNARNCVQRVGPIV